MPEGVSLLPRMSNIHELPTENNNHVTHSLSTSYGHPVLEDKLSKLPVELHQLIASNPVLLPQDRARLAQVNRTLNQSLYLINLSDKLTAEIKAVVTLKEYQKKVKDIQELLKKEPSLQVGPLSALGKRVRTLPIGERLTAVTDLLDAIQALPIKKYQAKLLVDLNNQLTSYRVRAGTGKHQMALDNVLLATKQLSCSPKERIKLITIIYGQRIRLILEEQRLTKLNEICDIIETRLSNDYRAEPFAILVDQISSLPEYERLAAFNRLLNAITALTDNQGAPLTDQAVLLTRLAQSIEKLPRDMLLEYIPLAAFNRLFDAIEAIPVTDRAEPLTALAPALHYLPKPECLAAFNRLFDAIEAIPAERRANPITALATTTMSRWLPKKERLAVFERLFDAIEAMPVKHRAKPLTPLADSITWLPPKKCLKALKLVLRAILKLPSQPRLNPLTALRRNTVCLPKNKRREASNVIDSMLQAALGNRPDFPGAPLWIV